MSIPTRLFYRVEEVAELLKISLRTAYRAIEKGEIPSTKIRGCIRVPVGQLEAQFGLQAHSGHVAGGKPDNPNSS
jgi:excisionase family DNA binding protein